MNQIYILVLFDGKGTTKTAKLMILCYLILILFYQSIKRCINILLLYYFYNQYSYGFLVSSEAYVMFK